MLNAKDTAVVLIDVQAKLLPAIHGREALVENLVRLLRGAKALGVPVIATEQNPAGLGPTVPELAGLLDGPPIAKMSFGCCGEPAFVQCLAALGRRNVLAAGIEAHVCVYQTVCGLLEAGRDVHVVADGVSSRKAANRDVAIARMSAAGAKITSVEMALFEMLQSADSPAFKEILRIVK